MTFWTPDNIRKVASGTWLARPKIEEVSIDGVSIDSRTIAPGNVFVAISGDRFDGHAYARDAVAGGASMCIVSKKPDALREPPPGGVVRVGDTRVAFRRLARAYLKTLKGLRVVGITGSVGKTTLVRLVDAALQGSLRGTASIKSFNNDIGVPLTALRAQPGDRYLVCEVGMNEPGEIAPLSETIEPDVGVITRIGSAHIGAFGSREGIAREKAALLTHLQPNGLAVLPHGESLLDDVARTLPNVITFGSSSECDVCVRAKPTRDGLETVFELPSGATVRLPLLGAHHASNVAAALAVARRFNVDDDAFAAALASFDPPEMRGQPVESGGVLLVNDAYNASPDSAEAGLRAFAALIRERDPAARPVIVLGDMLELGDEAPEAHARLGRLFNELFAERDVVLVTVGPMALFVADGASRAGCESMIFSEMTADVAERIASRCEPGAAVYLKGSRAIGLEAVAKAIGTRHAGAGRAT
ncbi:MAG: UDP-N-acetylmuramoyl-tripeptide--D-alanyl-D-alanine ligase [Planctomycetota bacterium]